MSLENNMTKEAQELKELASKELDGLVDKWKMYRLRKQEGYAIDMYKNGLLEIVRGDNELQALKHALVIARTYVEDEYESVDHPSHYGGANSKHEAIEVIEEWGLGFHLGNVVKYISRAGRKPSQDMIQDLKKAKWYLERFIEKNDKKT